MIDAGDDPSHNVKDVGQAVVQAADAGLQGNPISMGTVTIPEGVVMTMKGNVAVKGLVIKARARLTVQGNLQFRPGNAVQLVMAPSSSLTVNGNLACPSGMVASIDATAAATVMGDRSAGCPF